MTLSAPGKTFLVGEYIAMYGGPVFVINSGPRFQLKVGVVDGDALQGIHPESPAGLFVKNHHQIFGHLGLKFFDPHEGRGGVGASSAQFGLCLALKKMLTSESEQLELSTEEILEEYLKVAWSGEGMPPSGADLISQLMGSGITYFAREKKELEAMDWPFENLDFVVFRTGVKLATHEHLKEVNIANSESAATAVEKVRGGLKNKDETVFIDGMTEFQNFLLESKCVAPATVDLLEIVNSWDGVKVAKGCGALGADMVLVILDKSEKEHILSEIKSLDKELVATSQDLTGGLNIDEFGE